MIHKRRRKAKYKFEGDATPTLKSSRNQDFTKLDLQKLEGRGIEYTQKKWSTRRGEPSHNLKSKDFENKWEKDREGNNGRDIFVL